MWLSSEVLPADQVSEFDEEAIASRNATQRRFSHDDSIRYVRFGFGENWLEFAELIDEGRIVEAELSLQRLCGRDRLDDQRLIDVGSGSGLSSLAARRLGARVHSFDYDSVACTARLRDRQRPSDADWSVEQGSILDPLYLAGLGTFDIVYSWGVLHHTGALQDALARAASLVGARGLYESITPVDVAASMDRLGLEHVCSFVTPAGSGIFGSGCDEYVYRRAG